jgi:hypothetical protein
MKLAIDNNMKRMSAAMRSAISHPAAMVLNMP